MWPFDVGPEQQVVEDGVARLAQLRRRMPLSDQQIAEREEMRQGPIGNTVRQSIPSRTSDTIAGHPPPAGLPYGLKQPATPLPEGLTVAPRVAPQDAIAAAMTPDEFENAGMDDDALSLVPNVVLRRPMPPAPERPVSRVRKADGNYPVYQRGGEMSQSFNQAFGEARRRGDKTFEWQGRVYGTKMARGR